MKYLLSKEQVKNADSAAIKNFGISSAILMENAARSAFEIIKDKIARNHHILIICGSGNNGGDGFALARHLFINGFSKTRILFHGSIEKMSEETKANYNIAINLKIDTDNINIAEDLDVYEFKADCIIESLIGVGADENLRGLTVDILRKANKTKALKIAIDIPAGLNADTGKAHPDAFRADITTTMFSQKTGMYLHEGENLCGDVHIANLSAPQKIIYSNSTNFILETEDIRDYLYPRFSDTSKFDYGRILIIAGCKQMPGAASLCSNAAIKSGAGLVELITPSIHPALLPEIMPTLVESTSDGTISPKCYKMLFDKCCKADVIAIGPGIGRNTATLTLVKSIIDEFSSYKSMVIDADALRVINTSSVLNRNVIITPHHYEFCFTFGLKPSEIEGREYELAKFYAKKLNCNILFKSRPTIITNGEKSFLNIYGNPGMATAGCGDVLTGIIASMIGQGVETLHAGALGSLIHSLAGDSYAKKYNQESLTASELINQLKELKFDKE
jgi:NAD(P)H-hydrate epimerase